MANANSKIGWTDATWSPVTGCSKVSPGCAHCYAETISHRFGTTTLPWTPENAAENVQLHPERLDQPLRWRKPRMVFVNSMSDLFHEQVSDEFLAQVFARMALAQQHTFQILTKRPERMLSFCSGEAYWWGNIARIANKPYYGKPLPNVWLGTSVENQHWADIRIPLLLETPAAVRWISAEPLLGPVDIRNYCQTPAQAVGPAPRVWGLQYGLLEPSLDWVVVGGESGPLRRPMELEWARSLRDQCRAAGVPYFGKQNNGLRPGMPLPGDLGLREFPR